MATPKQGKELHQLKLKLTKDPRATSIKLPTPTKQHPGKLETASSPDGSVSQPKAPAAMVMKLSEGSMPGANPVTPSPPTKSTSKSPSAILSMPSATKQQSSTTHPATNTAIVVKSQKQQQQTLMIPPLVVKSPRKRQATIVTPPVVKKLKHQLSSANPVVVKSKMQQQAVLMTAELSSKHKPAPLNLVVVQPEPKQQPKRPQSILPTSRVRTIMKTNIKSSSSEGPLNISQDSVAVISKATVCPLIASALS